MGYDSVTMTTEQITPKHTGVNNNDHLLSFLVSVSQEFGSGSAGWLSLRLSPEVAVWIAEAGIICFLTHMSEPWAGETAGPLRHLSWFLCEPSLWAFPHSDSRVAGFPACQSGLLRHVF